MSIVNTLGERIFIQATNPWAATIPNSSGAATVATADGLQHISCDLSANSNSIVSRVKSGTLGRLAARRGRRVGSINNLVVPLQGSGTAGTRCDADALISAIFGHAGTVSASTSVTFALTATNFGLTVWKFRDPAGSNIWNEVAVAGLIDSWEISFGEEQEAEIRVSGPCVDVIDKPNLSALVTAGENFGLTSFPTEPTAPTFLGTPTLAFIGSITINGQTFLIQSGRIYGTMGRSLRYAFNSYSAGIPINVERTLGFDFTLYEEDTSAQAALRYLSRTKGTFDSTIVLGNTAGNIHTFTVNNAAIDAPTGDSSGAESTLAFTGTASITNTAANDEIGYVQT
jgi:hypothetical protein